MREKRGMSRLSQFNGHTGSMREKTILSTYVSSSKQIEHTVYVEIKRQRRRRRISRSRRRRSRNVIEEQEEQEKSN